MSDLYTALYSSRWEENGIKSELAGLIIAPEDYVAPNGKRYFTYDEAMELEEKVLKPNGWRLPTANEWTKIVAEFGTDENPDAAIEVLNLESNGFIWDNCMKEYNKDPKDYDSVIGRGVGGHWWSATATSSTYAYLLYTFSGRVIPQDINDRGDGFAVRCVKEDK